MATLNLAAIIEQHARRRPDRVAVVFGETRMTFGELDAWANRIAGGLAASGISRGDHVALLCPNLPYFPAAYFGILKTGATVVPLNVLLKPREIAYHLRDSDAKALLCFEGTAERPMAEAAKAAVAVVPSCEQFIVMPREGSDAFARTIPTSPRSRSSPRGSRPHSTRFRPIPATPRSFFIRRAPPASRRAPS